MKNKLIIFSISAAILLLFTPSIPAAQYNIALEENRTRFIEEISQMDINEIKETLANWDINEIRDSLESNIQELRQKLDDPTGPYIDVELILIILLQITAMVIQRQPSLYNLIVVAFLSALVIYELTSGEELPRTVQMHTLLVQSFFSVIMALESKLVKQKIPQLVIIFLTYLISNFIVNVLVGTTPT